MAKVQMLDFTQVKDGGGEFRKKLYPPGDYQGKIVKVVDAKKKDDPSKDMWLFTIEVKDGKYPYYCTFDPNSAWKIRNLFVAAGKNVPKKKLKIDPKVVVGAIVGVTLEDDEYEGKINSVVQSVFPASELNGSGDDEVDLGGDDEEGETSEPKAKSKEKKGKKGKKSKELEELDIEDV